MQATERHMQFIDRYEAGRMLARRLGRYADRPDVNVLALPNDGVPVAYEIAEALNAPLDVFLVGRLPVPGHEELTMGAVASRGVRLVHESVLEYLRIDPVEVESVIRFTQTELERREALCRGYGKPAELCGHINILVDEGLTEGSIMRTAVLALKMLEPAEIVVATPVAAPALFEKLNRDFGVVCVSVVTPHTEFEVGDWYQNFTATTDVAICRLLREANAPARFWVA